MRAITARSMMTLLAAASLAAGLSGCGTTTHPSPVPAPVGTGTAASPAVTDKGVITADGYGPYQLKLTLAKAKSDSLLADEQSGGGCPGWVTAKGVGDYAEVELIFYEGELAWLDVNKAGHVTATGAEVGAKLADVKAMYASATELDGPAGAKALSVVSGKNTIFLYFTAAGSLERISAGGAETMEFRYVEGEGC